MGINEVVSDEVRKKLFLELEYNYNGIELIDKEETVNRIINNMKAMNKGKELYQICKDNIDTDKLGMMTFGVILAFLNDETVNPVDKKTVFSMLAEKAI